VYALDLATGSVKWQQSLNGVKAPNGTFDATQHAQRPAALIVNGYAYFAFGGNVGDCGAYHGWVVAVSLDGDPSKTHAFMTDDKRCGIWGPGGPSSDGESVFVATGNGTGPASWAGSEAVLRLGLDLSFTKNPMDFYTPQNFAALDGSDTDISGSNPIVIDALGMKFVMALGKDGNAYLIDRTNLGGVGATLVGKMQVSTGVIDNAAAWATIGGTTYVVANGTGCPNGGASLVAIKLDMAAPGKMSIAWCANGGGRTSPIITSSDGTNDAIVWIAGEGPSQIYAYDLLTGTAIPNRSSIAGMQHLSPSVMAANGRIYAASNNGKVYAVMP
jgi:outer membrane protein assembly factor BamB